MGLTSVLVDRARVIRRAAVAQKVAGRTSFVESEPGTWFDCRLFLPEATEQPDPQRVYKRAVQVPTLLVDLTDDNGDDVDVKHTDFVEVDSDDLGFSRWQVTAVPQAIRKKEGVIGFTVTLKRIEAEQFEAKL